MIWFTSDLHLGHRAAIGMCERPFETVEKMNEILICKKPLREMKKDLVSFIRYVVFSDRRFRWQ